MRYLSTTAIFNGRARSKPRICDSNPIKLPLLAPWKWQQARWPSKRGWNTSCGIMYYTKVNRDRQVIWCASYQIKVTLHSVRQRISRQFSIEHKKWIRVDGCRKRLALFATRNLPPLEWQISLVLPCTLFATLPSYHPCHPLSGRLVLSCPVHYLPLLRKPLFCLKGRRPPPLYRLNFKLMSTHFSYNMLTSITKLNI